MRKYWQNLEELESGPPAPDAGDEFPNRTPDWNDSASRRRFLTLMGASLALGSAACTKQPVEKIAPYVNQPEGFVPGARLFFATTFTMHGYGQGVLAESHLGRPTKIEGNPLHPASMGATDTFMQASVLTLWDPDRSQVVAKNGGIASWGEFIAELNGLARATPPVRLRILTGTVTSPTLSAQLNQVVTQSPEVRWHRFDPFGRHASSEGTRLAFGRVLNPVYRFDRAERIVALDADFLCSSMPGSVRYAYDFAARRRAAASGAAAPVRVYAAECSPSRVGGMADHRLPMRASDVEGFAAGLARAVGLTIEGNATENATVAAVVRDLQQHRGACVVVPGEFQPPRVHAIAHALNQALGNTGETVYYTQPIEANAENQVESLTSLVNDMRAGMVDAILILGVNPVYSAPAGLGFGEALQRVRTRMHLGLYADETATLCNWHVPEAHYLESWGDARAFDGTISLAQPLIAPLYEGKTAIEVVNILLDRAGRSAYDSLRDYYSAGLSSEASEDFWRTALHDGVMRNTQYASIAVGAPQIPPPAERGQGMEVVFRPDPTIGDGAFANNAWLQELPKPQNQITWDNAAWISPRDAEQQDLKNGDRIEVALNDRKVTAPVWIMPGQAEGSITLHFGYGRSQAGSVANGIGFNAYSIWPADAPGQATGATIARQSGSHEFAIRQDTERMEGREPVRVIDAAALPSGSREELVEDHPQLFPLWEYPGYKWGMAIDLNTCLGCGACSVACQAENNIPVVGKEEVIKGRHMNWIRVDRYFAGSAAAPEMYFQPVPCMHCENAPCELVCPVAATIHNGEGLNEMVYNRCVGTRYCSNNCPYKVRRFNFLRYADWYTPSLYGLRNPDVSVRSRGVMEKCTYCVQRIERAKIAAAKENRTIREGEIVTACQQACPTQSIVFGNLNDPNSEVVRRKRQQRDYGLLTDLNTRPRTTYQARVRNPNPEIQDA